MSVSVDNKLVTGASIKKLKEYIDIRIGDVAPSSVKHSNRNLLDNPFFSVNQREWTSGNVGWQVYTVDRWWGTANTMVVTKNDGYLTISDSNFNSQFRQGIEPKGFPFEKEVTLSFDVETTSATDISIGGWASNTDNVSGWWSSGNISVNGRKIITTSVTLPKSSYVGVFLTVNGTVKVYSSKLELGSQSTLAYDSAPNYTTELLKCQRYYYCDYERAWNFIASSATALEGTYQFPVEMRVTPNVTKSNITLMRTSDGGAWNITFNNVLVSKKSIASFYNLANFSMSSGTRYSVNIEASADL